MDSFLLDYPANISRDDDGSYLVTIAGLPGATSGDTEAEALANASDLLETVLMGFILERADIPAPEAANGRPIIAPSLLGNLKLGLYRAMRDRGWRKADLARALGVNPRQADRLLDLEHASTVAQLDQALRVCGVEARVETRRIELVG